MTVCWQCSWGGGEQKKKFLFFQSSFVTLAMLAWKTNKQTKKYAFNLSVITSWYLAGDSAQTGFANLFNDRVYTQECITCYVILWWMLLYCFLLLKMVYNNQSIFILSFFLWKLLITKFLTTTSGTMEQCSKEYWEKQKQNKKKPTKCHHFPYHFSLK